MEKKRIRDFGIVPGRVKTGKRNAITDVPGVLVGHCTVNTEENHTGVTVIVPGPGNAFANHYTAAAYVHKHADADHRREQDPAALQPFAGRTVHHALLLA